MMSVTPYLIAGTYGTIGALAITAADKLQSRKDEINEESKSNFFIDLARNLAIGIFTPIAVLGLAKAAVYLKVLPILSSALASFLALSVAVQIAIPVIIIATIVLAIAIPVLLSRCAAIKDEKEVILNEEIQIEVLPEDKNEENVEELHSSNILEDISLEKNSNSLVLDENENLHVQQEIIKHIEIKEVNDETNTQTFTKIEKTEVNNETNTQTFTKIEKHEEVISTPEIVIHEEVTTTKSLEKSIGSLSLENSADLSSREGENELNGTTPYQESSPRGCVEKELEEVLKSL
ncbi:MAG: hypothetical protein H0T62_04105 [Parachlamydiaceae bacterium]|nr:hypothetical protein [Parachlamydiaceae bacterium]